MATPGPPVRKPQGGRGGFVPSPGRGPRPGDASGKGSPAQPTRAAVDGAPARQTVGFATVNERLVFAAQLLIGYTVQVQVRIGP